MAGSERNQFVDVMRGIAMLLVVLGHTMTGCTTGSQESFLFNIVWSLQMPLFILISGYVTRFSRGIKDGKGLGEYIKRRTIAYVIPWFVWSFIVRGIIFGESNFLNIWWLLWHMDSGYWFLATIWTISMIFGISTFTAKRISKDSEINQQIITLIMYIIGMAVLAGIGFIAGFSFFAIKLTLYYMPFYFVGYLYGQYRDRILGTKWGKTAVDVVIAICLAVWLLIMTRYHLYALPDSGLSIVLRVASSITGCVAVCGLCKSLFTDRVDNGLGGGTTPLVWSTLPGNLPHQLSTSEPSKDGRFSSNIKHTGGGSIDQQFCDHSSANSISDQPAVYKQDIATRSIWKQKLENGFLWAGKKSLDVYMVHGLLLNVLMPEIKPVFPSIEGYGLISGNFAITIFLCVIVISLISQSSILKKILGMK